MTPERALVERAQDVDLDSFCACKWYAGVQTVCEAHRAIAAFAAEYAREQVGPCKPYCSETHCHAHHMMRELAAARQREEEAKGEIARLKWERDDIAYKVEHPEFAHLHYDGCPFKPWSDKYDGDIPDPRPDCTCGEAAKGAYWKGQHMLERGYHELTRRELDALRAENARLTLAASEKDGQIAAWMETVAQESRNRDYYRALVVEIGELFGVAACTADDGGIADDVLCAKVPELVRAQLIAASESARRLQVRIAELEAGERHCDEYHGELADQVTALREVEKAARALFTGPPESSLSLNAAKAYSKLEQALATLPQDGA